MNGISSYLAFTGQIPNKTDVKVEFKIKVNGKVKWTTDNESQASTYWAGLNIFGGNKASLLKDGKVIAKKS